MLHTSLLVLITPFVGLVLFGTAYWGAVAISRLLPEGRVKRLLFTRL